MIHYHGTPITPRRVLHELSGCHFCVSFASPSDIQTCREIGQSVMLDNGAFSVWRRGIKPNWPKYYEWVETWLGPSDFAVIPDVIVGDDELNDTLIEMWPHGHRGSPVWHFHESIDRLKRLVDSWPLVCMGSSAQYEPPLSDRWEARMDAAINAVCSGRFIPRLHGLRMMACSGRRWPLASVDSTDIARNHKRPQNNAVKMAKRWDSMQTPHFWVRMAEQMDLVA